MEAYEEEEISQSESEGESDEEDYGEEDQGPELQASFADRERINIGNVMQARDLGKEGIYRELTLRPVMRELFETETNIKADSFVSIIEERLPKYWYKNPKALGVAIKLFQKTIETKKDMPTPEMISALSSKYDILGEDIYRYYKLVKKYNII